MHNHNGSTCLACLHCEFSNVSSNCLPEKRHSHIGCICSTFLRCVFSNVTSVHLDQSRHSHTGCICLTFLHCAFSNESSSCLPERLQIYTDSISLIFFPLWVFICDLTLLAWEDAYSHWLHKFDFSPLFDSVLIVGSLSLALLCCSIFWSITSIKNSVVSCASLALNWGQIKMRIQLALHTEEKRKSNSFSLWIIFLSFPKQN